MKLTLAAALALVLGCTRGAPPAPAGTNMDSNDVTIHEGGQARLGGGFDVGASNFWEDGGQLTCALTFSSPYRTERVRQGQVLEHAGRRLEVVRIQSAGGGRGQVVVRELAPPGPGSP